MDKTKTFWWIISLLVVLNLTTVTTILYRNHQVKTQKCTAATPLNWDHLSQTLEFCTNDKCEVNVRQEMFRTNAARIVANMDEQRRAMFVELNQPKPDTEKLDRLSKNMGDLHAELKKKVGAFYLEIKGYCTTLKQKEDLKEMFTPLFK
jgi:hypothetical protein